MANFTQGKWKIVTRSGRFRIFSDNRTITETPLLNNIDID